MKLELDINQIELVTIIKTMNRVDMSNFSEDVCELYSFFIDELQDALNYGLYTN